MPPLKLRTTQQKSSLEPNGVPDREKRGGANGQRVSLPVGITHKQSERWQDVARVPEEKFEAFIAERREKEERLVSEDLLRKPTHVSQNTGQPEWYTPPEYIEAAREVLGGGNSHGGSSVRRGAADSTPVNSGLWRAWRRPVPHPSGRLAPSLYVALELQRGAVVGFWSLAQSLLCARAVARLGRQVGMAGLENRDRAAILVAMPADE